MSVTVFPVTSPVSKTFAFLRAHYAIFRYMFTVGFQCNFRKITARFSAGRRKQLVVNDILLFLCSYFKYRFIKIDLVTVRKFGFNFSRVLGGVVDCVNVNASARAIKPWLAWCAERVRTNKSSHRLLGYVHFFYKNVVFPAQAEYSYFLPISGWKYSCIIFKLYLTTFPF